MNTFPPIPDEERTEAAIEVKRISTFARDMSRIDYTTLEDPNEIIKALASRLDMMTLRPAYILTGKHRDTIGE